MSQPSSSPAGARPARRLRLRPLRVRRVRPLLIGAVVVLGLAATLPSCRAAARLGIFRMTPAASEFDSATLGNEAIMNDPNIAWNGSSCEGLDEGLVTALQAVAAEYAAETGQPVVINSAARTLRRQAELMAEMSQDQLEGMYCRQGYPSYIQGIVDARRRNRGAVDAQATYDILAGRDEGFISSHLFGAAVDVSPSGADVALLRKLLEKHGFTTLDERGLGVNCLHATYRDAPRRIVRR
jgi:hypothetical protein